eukprot:m.87963 g.87963  ORF g.87963 m.87963 type:complete len:434 (-) comp12260_c0_seq1:3745-5046(-)
MRVRTVTVFVHLHDGEGVSMEEVLGTIKTASRILQTCKEKLEEKDDDGCSLEVQTLRISFTDPKKFLPWNGDLHSALKAMDGVLEEQGIQFCSLGRIENPTEEDCAKIPEVIASSGRLNVSVNMESAQFDLARAVAKATKTISQHGDGLGNFRFCASARAQRDIPFFPASCATPHNQLQSLGKLAADLESDSNNNNNQRLYFSVGVGLENGDVLNKVMASAGTVDRIEEALKEHYLPILTSIEDEMTQCTTSLNSLFIGEKQNASTPQSRVFFRGIDTSFNPSLDEGEPNGSIAAAFEALHEVDCFGDLGTTSAVAISTMALQALPVSQTGYRGLMLPVCEDRRLAQIGVSGDISISSLLLLSCVCGVGIDTVPIAGDFSEDRLARLYLDVAGLANRWDKPLSCRVFPVQDTGEGEMTTFNSPYLVNSHTFKL